MSYKDNSPAAVANNISTTDFPVDEFNNAFKMLSPIQRLERLYEIFNPEEILFTSSFGTNSAYLLFLLSKVNKKQKIHFINTGFLFEETLRYKNELAERFELELIELTPQDQEHALTEEEEWWKDHPKMCCAINKIAPLDKVKKNKKIWVSGLLGNQTVFRTNLEIFSPHGDLYKFHPLLDIDEGELLYQASFNKLPQHPLADFGYGSVGCTHCTIKGEGRSGRWANSEKTECGLHTHYFNNKKELNESK